MNDFQTLRHVYARVLINLKEPGSILVIVRSNH